MKNIQATSLVQALQSNMVAFWEPYGRAAGNVLVSSAEAVWFYTGIQFPLFNGVLSLDTVPDHVTSIFENFQSSISQHRAPALWWIAPHTSPQQTGSLLQRWGLSVVGEVPAMALDLDRIQITPQTIPGFEVARVDTDNTREIWARIAAIGTGLSTDAAKAMEKLELAIDDPQYSAQNRYIGYLDGAPVATSALVFAAGVAGIYAVATLPQARNKGIGTMMTRVPLEEARGKGFQHAVLQASSSGYRLYQKLGFEDVFSYTLYLQTDATS